MSTVFDKILAREIPANVVYEDEYALAFHDINPTAPVHVLVIPKKKIRDFTELQTLGPAYIGEFMLTVAKVAEQLGLNPDGYRVITNIGKNGQQTVPYLHLHILGGRELQWPPG